MLIQYLEEENQKLKERQKSKWVKKLI
jgi:hypothetical protein